ncbi:alpha-protein kinase 3 [Rhineura floridana]|uniref:alpha-protein kinase 3 n=1 Tax=Rhineura floridana TaxID=261503 RepID=UPI002AC80610|nr:alpha-protein kinase 3 [Rhineura floridana]
MGSRRRPLGRSYSGNGPYTAYSAGQGSDGEDNGPLVEHRPERRNYLLSVRPESRSTFCAIIAQLTEETQPLFQTTLKSFAVSENADAKFTCIVMGYPQPEVTWYKNDEEMDRYCGLPKYEIFRHGNRHTLQLYKCREEDAAIYQASARNNKGIVSCSGVLEVGTMTEFRIHQRWFAKLKRNAEVKLREIEQSRKRGKENVELVLLRRVSPDRFQRKRRLTGEVGMRSGASLWDKEEVSKVRIPDGKPRLGEDEKAKSKEMSLNVDTLFSNNFIAGHLEAEVATNGDSSLESGEENGEGNANGFLNYICETVEIIKARPAGSKEFSAKKKKKEENALPNATQNVSRQEDKTQPRRTISAQKDAAPSALAHTTTSSAANKGRMEVEPRERPSRVREKPTSTPRTTPPKGDIYFSLKDMYFDMGVKSDAEKKVPEDKAGGADMNQTSAQRASILEEKLPAARTALKRTKLEEGRKEPREVKKGERKGAIEAKDTKTTTAIEAAGDINAPLFQYPNRSAEAVRQAQGSLRMGNAAEIPDQHALETDFQHSSQTSETGVGARTPLSKEIAAEISKDAGMKIRETDLLDSLPTEVEAAPPPQKPVVVDSSTRLQEAVRDLQEASLEEQLHRQGPCEAPENLKPALPAACGLQTPDTHLREETSQEASDFARRKGVPGEPETKWSEEQAGPSPEVQEPSQEDIRYTPATSQNPPAGCYGITPPIAKERLVLKEEVGRHSARFGSGTVKHRPAPSHKSIDLAAPGLLTEESSLKTRPAVVLGKGASQAETVSKEKQVGDHRPGLKMDVGLESERLPVVTARPLSVPEAAVEAPGSYESIPETPPIPALSEPRESAPLSLVEEGLAERDQSVVHLLKDVKREIESWPPDRSAASESEQQQVSNTVAEEICSQEKPPTPPRVEENEQEAFSPGKKLDVGTTERERSASEAPLIQDTPQPETAMEEDQTPEKAQHKNLVSSLKNYLLLLLKITSDTDKSKGSKKREAKAAEEQSPPTAIPRHLPDVGIAGLTPRTSRKIFERVETDQLFQSAESLQLTPKTSRRLTGMINQELLACQESLAAEPEAPLLPCVPSIVVGSPSGELAGLPDMSLEVSSEALSALPSATPQELASGARRKIFLPKAKQADELDGVAPDDQMRAKRDSPTVSPQQSRKNAALLQTPAPASPPVERHSPTLARKMATLEVPKIYEEPAEESKNVTDSSLGTPERLEEATPEVQAGEFQKANDPFKAPQVIRKIRAEQFSDASGNLKLWCQFFNILSDSKLTWYKDEVPVADAKRSSGDEGQAALAIVQVSLKDRGVYQCTIQNDYGTDSTDFLLSAEVLSGFISKEEIEVGEEIEMTPMVFAKGLADSGFWGDKLFGRIMMEDLEVGQGFLRKACRARAIYGLEPVFESGHTGIIKVRNLIAFGGRSESTLVERNYDITIQECKIQNSSREYCKIFAAEARAIPAFGPVPEIIPLYLIYRPANNIPYATMEEDLPGLLEHYCSRGRNGSLTPANPSEVGQKCCAFQHWLYLWTNGNILVTDLEGVGWKVTNVRIATKTKGYQGLKESCCPSLIDHFAASHQCNRFCDLLGLKSIEIPQPPTKGKGSRSPITGRKTPSAQSSPQLQKKGLTSPQASRKGSVSPKSARKCPESAGELQSVARPKGGDSGKAGRLQ